MKTKMSILCALMLAVIVTSYSVSGTYAKYTSAIDKTDEARVAKWDISSNIQEFELFKNSYKDVDGSYEIVKAIDANDSERLVAPGTSGKYTFTFNGVLETNYTLLVSDKDSSNNVVVKEGDNIIYNPIRFRVTTDGTTPYTGNWVSYENLIKEINKALGNTYGEGDTLTKKVYAPGRLVENGIGNITIEWKWPFDSSEFPASNVTDAFVSSDIHDTTLGKNAVSHEIKIGLTITAEQSKEQASA